MAYDAPRDRYEFSFAGGQQNLYYFTTGDEVIYEIKFVPSAYLFVDYLEDHVDAFEMVIAVADNPVGKRVPADPTHRTHNPRYFLRFFSVERTRYRLHMR